MCLVGNLASFCPNTVPVLSQQASVVELIAQCQFWEFYQPHIVAELHERNTDGHNWNAIKKSSAMALQFVVHGVAGSANGPFTNDDMEHLHELANVSFVGSDHSLYGEESGEHKKYCKRIEMSG